MNIEELREFCLSLPHTTEDVKWGNDLCLLIGKKMFLATGLNGPFSVSFKVTPEDFDRLSNSHSIIPAPYLARYKWINVSDKDRFTRMEWEKLIQASYEMVKSKLPKKILHQFVAESNDQ